MYIIRAREAEVHATGGQRLAGPRCMCIHVCIHTYIYIYIYIYICMYVCMYACMYVCMCVYIYIYIHTCIHVYMYIGDEGQTLSVRGGGGEGREQRLEGGGLSWCPAAWLPQSLFCQCLARLQSRLVAKE